MDKGKVRGKFFLLFITTFTAIIFVILRVPRIDKPIPKPLGPPNRCPSRVSYDTITPLNKTKHLLVSAYMDQRVKGFDIRIIGIFRRDSIQPLYCLFCCRDRQRLLDHTWLPIRNLKTKEEETLQINFTVCISGLFGNYNNVLQFAQTLEMYRLLGVDRVVIYNTSCGPELTRLLHGYSQEGFVELVSWPIDKHLNPSYGWLFSESGGDVHYFGQQTTLNECIYRSMGRSRYVLLNDIDEIIMPYQHNNLVSLMNMLQQQHPNAGVFTIENHIFPKKHFEPSGKFHLPQWIGVPGVNMLEHIYREDPDRSVYHPHKLLIRMVEQTSVHEVLKNFGERYKVPPDICRIIHIRIALQGSLTLEQLKVDKRLWDFSEKLIPNVDKGLKRAGLLSSNGQS
uniref:Glycosyltransferase family 92 protein n=1 Tax=Mola mola TaxID=94237 RepID=A0A3Q3W4Z5_MOLML